MTFSLASDRGRVQLFCGDSMTEQHHKDSCDINFILRKYQSSGILTHYNEFEGNYGDFTDVLDYHESMNKVIAADSMFKSLPSSVRFRFNNDPALFLDFVHNPDNVEELRKMGLTKSSVVSESVPTGSVNNEAIAPAEPNSDE